MAYIHTIEIAIEKASGSTVSSTRKSENRRYLACIVATTTEESLRIDAQKKAEIEKKLADAKARLIEMTAKLGMTSEQAQAQHKADSDRWFDREDGSFATADRIRKETGRPNAHISGIDHLVKADLLKRGFVDPWDKNGTYGIVDAQITIDQCEGALQRKGTLLLGSQSVMSWHGTVANAQKALGGLDYLRALGDSLAIRTDITIKETKKRGV